MEMGLSTSSEEFRRLVDGLQPFVGGDSPWYVAERLQLYLELLLKWNERVNLTAVRQPEEIIRRHFGESLFAAKLLFGHSAQPTLDERQTADPKLRVTLADVGSGAGFPGIPIKLWSPHAELTLIESLNKKATFLREVVRALKLEGAQVFCGRAEERRQTADVVTLRAVEHFERVLPVAMKLVAPGGRLCLLIGTKQVETARRVAGNVWTWSRPEAVPQSQARVVIIAKRLSAGSGNDGSDPTRT